MKIEVSKNLEATLSKDDVKILAMDDINLRKGNSGTGCSVFVDGETHQVLIIVKGTTSERAKQIIDMFPSAEIVCSDRGKGYMKAGSESEKIQVADRFHLIANAQDAVWDVLESEIPAAIFIKKGEGWVPAEGGLSATESFYVPEHIVEERIRLADLTNKQATRYRNTLKVLELDGKGLRSHEIARKIGISVEDVRMLRRNAAKNLKTVGEKVNDGLAVLNAGTPKDATGATERPGENAPGTKAVVKRQKSVKPIVDPYREAVISLWKEGGNHRTILPVISEMGYDGSANAIYQYLLMLGKELPNVMARERRKKPKTTEYDKEPEPGEQLAYEQSADEVSLEKVTRRAVYRHVLSEAKKRSFKVKKKKTANPGLMT